MPGPPDRIAMHGSVAVIFNRFGPYHLARLRAAAARMRIIGIEVFGKDKTYGWEVVRGDEPFRRVTLFETQGDHIRRSQVQRAITELLERERPSAVAMPGWSSREALSALSWCLRFSVPAILMTDSQRHDRGRNPLGEGVKQRVVPLYSAALVAGTTQMQYTADLGMDRNRIYCGYDVLDNEHFRSGAAQARADASLRARLGLPPRYFLTCCRFIWQKNLPRLLEAYGRYCVSSPEPWGLVLLGDGPLRAQVEGAIHRRGLGSRVLIPGFVQYDALPAYYGLAEAAILASVSETWGLTVNEGMAAGLPVLVSSRCGCARDLVEEGRNGFTFDPYDVEALSHLMLRLSSAFEDQRQAMGRASQEIIGRWTPVLFADNLEKAIETARSLPQPSLSVLDRALIWLLIHRPTFVNPRS